MITPYLMPVIALVLGVVSLFHDKRKQKIIAYAVLAPLLCLSCGLTVYANYQSGLSAQADIDRWERLFALLEEERETEDAEVQELRENVYAQKEAYSEIANNLKELSHQPNLSNPVRANYVRLSEEITARVNDLESFEQKALNITENRTARWDEIETYIANPKMEIRP